MTQSYPAIGVFSMRGAISCAAFKMYLAERSRFVFQNLNFRKRSFLGKAFERFFRILKKMIIFNYDQSEFREIAEILMRVTQRLHRFLEKFNCEICKSINLQNLDRMLINNHFSLSKTFFCSSFFYETRSRLWCKQKKSADGF